MKRAIISILSLIGVLSIAAFADPVESTDGKITAIFIQNNNDPTYNDKLFFRVTFSNGTKMKFYAPTNNSNGKTISAFLLQAYSLGNSIKVTYESTNPVFGSYYIYNCYDNAWYDIVN